MNLEIISIKKRGKESFAFKFPLRDDQFFKILRQRTLPQFLVFRMLLCYAKMWNLQPFFLQIANLPSKNFLFDTNI